MFRPWCGSEWGNSSNILNGIRLLVLGESHYSPSFEVGDDDTEMTNWCVTEYLKGRSGHLRPEARRFFTKIAAIVSGRPSNNLSEADRTLLWNSISFYNYIPKIAAIAPGQAPPEHLWQGEAPVAFARTLELLRPNAVLVCGDRLWAHLPAGLEKAPSFEFEGYTRTARLYRIGDDRCAVAAQMWHPSAGRGWTVARWRPIVDFLLKQAELQRAGVFT